ncbi:MAG: Mth938-like domain-containing protein [Roseibium sp.]|uniref:Mth938-like domain-containing protein n=1 Tax=Roseibium sp. TaxID=1936156 RepID=UPI001B02C24F|nr:Mth938-like domain-containing protein [Roseibium sp.]MBO6894954.1 Mth938-like domain-containing protein [Roseibium sp.]MBO6931520.1 Mth938-like domain-containing protein [Roseibium sp.]
MEIRKAHFPGRAPLDAYGDGGFRFAQMSHRGSLLCLPSGIYGWDPQEADPFTQEAFRKVLEEQEDIEVLLIGTGLDLKPLPEALKATFREAGILADPMSTGAAVRTFNVLLSEDRAVAAALIAVD